MNKYVLLVFFLCLSISSIAQITLNFPLERSVFQRDNSNIGFISISGTTPQVVDSIQVRLSNLQSNSIYKNWFAINNQTAQGYFQDRIEAEGGWYKLDIRTWKNNRIDDFTSVQKVGVGEVFVISGQSNAQGVRNFGAEGAKSDLVNAVNYFNTFSDPLPPQSFEIVQLSDEVDIAPNGKTPWCWGALGDILVERLGVPVLFFNSAWQGTLSVNWFQSAQNIPTLSAVGEGILPRGFPYKNLETSLSNYASLFGVRSILWMQGETDTAPGIPNYQEYYDYIGFVIRQSRIDFGHNVPWVMARTSWVDGLASDLVTQAQRDLIDTPNLNVFEGPFTDTLMIPRFDFVHFGNNDQVRGLDLLAQSWSESLNDDFFNTSQPILTDPLVKLETNCSFLSTRLNIPTGTQTYFWNDGFRGNTKTHSSGIHSVIVRNEKQNYKLSNLFNASLIRYSANVTLESARTRFCNSDSLELTSGDWSSVLWNTGETTKSIIIKESRNVNYVAYNSLGCQIGNSNSLSLRRIDPPVSVENISFSNLDDGGVKEGESYIQCFGQPVRIEVDQPWEEYLWNGESLGKQITITSNQNLSFQGRYGGECLTPIVPVTNVRFTEQLTPPIISRNSIFSLNASGLKDTPGSFNTIQWFLNGNILAQQESDLFLENTGSYNFNYYQTYTNGLECASPLSEVIVVDELAESGLLVYPVPANSELSIESAKRNKNIRLEIFTQSGQGVFDQKVVDDIGVRLTKIQLNKLNAGIYFIKISTSESVIVKKFIKL